MKQKTVFCCSDCGFETPNWGGRCPSCGAWNTLVEVRTEKTSSRKSSDYKPRAAAKSTKLLSEIGGEEELRFRTDIPEFDRVLGGGAVKGSVILVGGAPGIGKSTLLLQMCRCVSRDSSVLYVSGEESERQLRMRADRLGIDGSNISIYTGTDVDRIIGTFDEVSPEIVVIDSIQTVYDSEVSSAAGSPAQIRESTLKLIRYSKDNSVTIFIVGHITKEGTIAGPKILEHMVDCVLYFEGERNTSFRILRAVKNRFGSTNEIGVFEMLEKGLESVDNPSEMLLSGRPADSSGTCVACIVEGTRPIMAEIQALVSKAPYNPSRKTNGIDYNRASMLIAVLDKRGNLPVSGCDVYINVIGGLSLDDPAADLSTVLALASSYKDEPVDSSLAALGEVGLSGEIRNISNLEQRLGEIRRLGFKKCIIPKHSKINASAFEGLEIVRAGTLREALRAASL